MGSKREKERKEKKEKKKKEREREKVDWKENIGDEERNLRKEITKREKQQKTLAEKNIWRNGVKTFSSFENRIVHLSGLTRSLLDGIKKKKKQGIVVEWKKNLMFASSTFSFLSQQLFFSISFFSFFAFAYFLSFYFLKILFSFE